MGFFKCQGTEVKLMVCKTDSKQNAHECWIQTFSNMQNQQLFKKESFSFQVWQDFSSSNPTEFSLRFSSYLCFELYWKTYETKTSFRATDLNYEINLFRFCFFYAKNSNHKHRLKEECPSLLTVQSQTLNLWEEFFSPQEGMTAPPKLKSFLTDPRLSPRQPACTRVLS